MSDLLFLAFLSIGCSHHGHQNHANVNMNKQSHEARIRSFDDQSRYTWQRPNDLVSRLGHIKGKKIDWSIVSRLISESDFVLAHNAGFDRPMIEAVPEVSEISSSKIWACSLAQIDWIKKGFLSSKQELLSLFHGFHYSGHRALTDIDALANILLQGDYHLNLTPPSSHAMQS